MLTTQFGRLLVALLAAFGLVTTMACEPGTFETGSDEQKEEGTTPQEDIGGGPQEPWAEESEGAATGNDEDSTAQPAEDGFEQGLNRIEEGLNEIRDEAQRRGEEFGTEVEEELNQIQDQVDQFEEEIRQDIENLGEAEGEPATEEPATEEPATTPEEGASPAEEDTTDW